MQDLKPEPELFPDLHYTREWIHFLRCLLEKRFNSSIHSILSGDENLSLLHTGTGSLLSSAIQSTTCVSNHAGTHCCQRNNGFYFLSRQIPTEMSYLAPNKEMIYCSQCHLTTKLFDRYYWIENAILNWIIEWIGSMLMSELSWENFYLVKCKLPSLLPMANSF